MSEERGAPRSTRHGHRPSVACSCVLSGASTPARMSSEPGVHLHTCLLRPTEVRACTHLEVCPQVHRGRPSEGCVPAYTHTQVSPSLTLHSPWWLPLLYWCFRAGRGTILLGKPHSYTGCSLLEKVSKD